MTYRYRPEVLEQLAHHGLRPRPETAPMFLRDHLSALYRYELRRLRERLRRREFARRDYADLVIATRRRYVLLSIPVETWTLP